MSMTRSRRVRLAGATVALLVVVLALVHLRAAGRPSPGQPAPVGTPRADAERAPPETPPAAGEAVAPESGEGPGAIHVRQAHLIESIDVEPAAPCRDQEVLVTVRLAPDARGSKVFVAGQPGSPMVLRFPRSGARPVLVVARDWYDRIEHQHISIDVRDCTADSGLTLAVRRFGSGRILARANGPAASSGAGFEWDFGDGAHAFTQAPFAEHDYALRDQAAATSTFLLAVRAPSSGDLAAAARASITFVNADYVAALSGTPTLPVRYDRFARRQQGAAVSEIQLRNVLPADVRWQTVETKAFSCDGAAEPVARTGDAGLALSSGAIAAGDAETLRLSIPADWLGPDACRVQVWLHGRAGPAEVRVPLALELGVPATRVPVTDPERLALLAKAARALGGTRFTVEDLARVQAMAAP
jgi:hypothetical protein